jgi:hypothetical protein
MEIIFIGFLVSWRGGADILKMRHLQKVVQCFCSHLIFLDAGACPGPDPGFAGMTFVVDL